MPGMGVKIAGINSKFDGQHWTSYDTLNSNIISNAVWDVHFDTDHNLWIGCNGGISIFDGVDFDNYMIDYPNGIIGGSAMIVEDSANIWIGTFRGLIHYNLLTDSVILYDKTNSNIPSIYISDIEFDKNGIMWLSFDYDFQGGLGHGGTNGGLATFDGSNFTAIWPLIDPHTSVWSLVVDSSNNIWVSTHGEGLYRFNQSNWIQIQEVPITGISDCVNLDRENNIWYVDRYSGVWTNSPAVGIKELNPHEQVKIFPNPATTKITIEGSDLSILSYKLYSVLGNEIKKLDGIRSNLLEISLEDVSAGVYFISLKTTKNEIITRRIVKR
jgi:ligand-binding sensor domain-containing protein